MSLESPTAETDVLIVGAGPVGLTLACELARHGVHHRIVDKASTASTTSKALAIHARTLEVLDTMDVIDTFLERGQRVNGMSLYSKGKTITRIGIDEVDSRYNFILDLPQYETEIILAEHLEAKGFTIERGMRLEGFTQGDDYVDATLARGDYRETVRARYLVGCDGSRSTVRKELDLPFEGEVYDENFVLADVHIDWDQSESEIQMYTDKQGIVAIFPMPGGRHRIIATVPTDGEVQLEIPFFDQLLKERLVHKARLHNPIWFSQFKIHHRIVPRYSVGRVSLAGDAAHIHSPAGGQGMNTGMQDAYNLGWKLALSLQQDVDLLESYSQEREPVGHDVLKTTDRMTRLMTMKNPLSASLRNRVLPVLNGLDAFQRRVRDSLEEIDIEYAHSPVIQEAIDDALPKEATKAFASGAIAGVRAPEGTVVHAGSGVAHRLYSFFRLSKHVLIIFTQARLDKSHNEASLECLDLVKAHYDHLIMPLIISGRRPPSQDSSDHPYTYLDTRDSVHEAYGVHKSSALFLIRPDSIIGYRSLPVDVAKLKRYLERVYPQKLPAELT
ncbi:MAG: FAD-dependent monooxygenase [Verrucomicrobiota bacterium]